MGCIFASKKICPQCHQKFPSSKKQEHFCNKSKSVIQSSNSLKMSERINKHNEEKGRYSNFLYVTFPGEPNEMEQSLYHGKLQYDENDYINVKVADDAQRTRFKWRRIRSINYPPSQILRFDLKVMRKRTFQQKMLWFRLNMEKVRINWNEGCETLKVDRNNIVMSSKVGLEKIDLRRQLKVQFDDQVVDDAGGLLREWMHLTIKAILSPSTNIFCQCKTQQTAYRFVWDKDVNEDYAKPMIKTLGIIIGKALFERVSINCYLCRTLWRQISGNPIILNDMFSFDEDFYKSCKYILSNKNSEKLELTMSELKVWKDKTSLQVELKKKGKSIKVGEENKEEYIFLLMMLYSTNSVLPLIQELLKGIYSVIPPQYLSIFEPHEFQMMVNGPQFIDVKDWKKNTLYRSYHHDDQTIIWFWSIVEKFEQSKLTTFLHYCTGTSRVPILGFKYLESNRNTIAPFTIEKIAFNNTNPYPKAHTCFNRLELPEYDSRMEMENYLSIILEQQISHFGLG